MRSRAPVALLAVMAGLAATPAVAKGADTLAPYSVEATPGQLADLKAKGFDVQEGGAAGETGVQEIELAATAKQAAALEDSGLELKALSIDKKVAKSAAQGESPNPYFNVYRSYMEKGGIADEMKAIAAANPDVMKLEQMGTSTLGKPIYVLKMTAEARTTPDGTRDAILFSAVNHAREWIAAEMGRRLPGWFAEHKNDAEIRALIKTREIWVLPIQNPDGYDFTFTCGQGTATEPCDYR